MYNWAAPTISKCQKVTFSAQNKFVFNIRTRNMTIGTDMIYERNKCKNKKIVLVLVRTSHLNNELEILNNQFTKNKIKVSSDVFIGLFKQTLTRTVFFLIIFGILYISVKIQLYF